MTWKTALLAVAMFASLAVCRPPFATGQRRSSTAAVSPRPQAAGVVNQAALEPFFRKLAAAESQARRRPVLIMQYGDSHTKADLFTGAVRRSLQREFNDGAYATKATSYRPAGGEGQAIVYEALGVNGARAKRLLGLTDDASFLQAVSRSGPDLIVIAYGTNEVTDNDWTVNSYERMLVEIISRCRAAAPSASFLIIAPPDRAVPGRGGWASAGRMTELIEAQRRAAFKAGAALWSEYDAMGGAGSMNAWLARGLARPDHVHFTAAGYDRLAAMFYSDLMNAYRGWQSDAGGQAVEGLDLRVMRGVPVTAKNPK